MVQGNQQHLGSTRTKVQSPAQPSGLRILALLQPWLRWQQWLGSDPWPRNFICHGAAKKMGVGCSHKISHTPRLCAEGVIWKEPGSEPLANLGEIPGKSRGTWDSPWDREASSSHFWKLVLPRGHWCWQAPFWSPPHSMLALGTFLPASGPTPPPDPQDPAASLLEASPANQMVWQSAADIPGPMASHTGCNPIHQWVGSLCVGQGLSTNWVRANTAFQCTHSDWPSHNRGAHSSQRGTPRTYGYGDWRGVCCLAP